MKKTTYFMAIMLAVFTIVSGCKKGDTGPQGPPGVNGLNGNANVTSITAIVNSSATWTWSSPMYYVDVTVPALTSDIMNTGAVEVFVNTDGTGSFWKALPYTVVTGTVNYGWQYVTLLNDVQVQFAWANGAQSGDPNFTYGASIMIKIVCIASSGIAKNPDLNFHDYEALKTTFHLTD